MTLEEYIIHDGKTRCSIGSVELKPEQCDYIGTWMGNHWYKVRPVSLKFGGEWLQYVQKNDSDLLWTQDEHGNPKARSVFSLPLN